MRAIFIDATEEMAAVFRKVARPDDLEVHVHIAPDVEPDELPGLLAGYQVVLNDHSFMPTEQMRRCAGLRHVVFLGTGARSYMHPEELAGAGITVHTIRGYGDTAVAEHAIALMWEAARGLAAMDRDIRAGGWPRREGVQLTGKMIGLLGFGGIAAEVARIAGGSGMRVLAWNRTPRSAPGVQFVPLDTLLAESDVLSAAPAADRGDARHPVGGPDRAAAAGGDPGEHGARRAGGRGGDGGGAAVGRDQPCGAGRVRRGAAAGGACADDAGERDAVGAQRVSHAGGERDTAAAGAGHRQAAGGRIECAAWPAWRNGRRSGLKIRGQ